MRQAFFVLKILFLLSSVLMIISCQNENIDGVWIGQYNILDMNGSKSYHNLNTVIKFEDNKFINHVLSENSVEQVFEYRRKGIAIIPLSKSHGGFNVVSVSEDSLVLSMPQMKGFTLVYKKHKKSFKAKPYEIVLNVGGKSYRSRDSKLTYDFKSDSSILINGKMKGDWELDLVESINVLKLTIGDSTDFMVIDSTVNDKLFLTRYSKNINNIVLIAD